MNALRELRCYEQSGENLQVEDAQLMRSMAEAFSADWQRWGFDGVYAFPDDMLRHSQQLHCRQRLLNFDLIACCSWCRFSWQLQKRRVPPLVALAGSSCL